MNLIKIIRSIFFLPLAIGTFVFLKIITSFFPDMPAMGLSSFVDILTTSRLHKFDYALQILIWIAVIFLLIQHKILTLNIFLLWHQTLK